MQREKLHSFLTQLVARDQLSQIYLKLDWSFYLTFLDSVATLKRVSKFVYLDLPDYWAIQGAIMIGQCRTEISADGCWAAPKLYPLLLSAGEG